MIFNVVGLHDVVVNSAKPEGADDNMETFNEIVSAAIVFLIQVIAKPILTIIGRISDPHQIWNHLRIQYYSDTAFSFIYELKNLFTIASTYDSTKPISKFIENFESRWAIIIQVSDGSNNLNLYWKKFNLFLRCDEAKHDILLSALVPYIENVIDNISTKTDITFAEAKSWLISRPSQSSSQDAALVVTGTKGNGKKSWKKRYHDKSGSSNNKSNSNYSSSNNHNHPNDSAKPWCTYCKKHNLMPFEGHTWMICRQLKEEQKKKKEVQKGKKKKESAHITTDQSQTLVILNPTVFLVYPIPVVQNPTVFPVF